MVGQKRRRWSDQSGSRAKQETSIQSHRGWVITLESMICLGNLLSSLEPVKPPGDPNKSKQIEEFDGDRGVTYVCRLETPFTITTQTGSVSGAGTDANVSITLNGDKNKITKYLLKKPEGGKNPFEKGQKDVFKFDEIDIGRVRCHHSNVCRVNSIYSILAANYHG